MYTQCPHCSTLFRISTEQLKIAAGKARCCQCNQVFNALQTLKEETSSSVADEPVPPAEELITTADAIDSEIEDQSLFADTLNLDSEQLIDSLPLDEHDLGMISQGTGESLLTASSDSLLMEQDDGLETEPDYLAAGTESQMSDLLDQDSASSIVRAEQTASNADVVPLETAQSRSREASTPHDTILPSDHSTLDDTSIPEEILSDDGKTPPFSIIADKSQENPENNSSHYAIDDMFEKQSLSYRGIAWGLGGLVLIGLLSLQLAWYHREQVIQYETGQALLTGLCNLIGCHAPQRRDTNQIQINHRALQAHPEKTNALHLKLIIVNRAAFDQPYPSLQLNLFNDSEKLIASRVFLPQEYLDQGSYTVLMPSNQPVQIVMELVDPGDDVTGFKFEFL